MPKAVPSDDERLVVLLLSEKLPRMVRVTRDTRVCGGGCLALGCSAAVRHATMDRVLPVPRADDGRWAVPGRYIEPGETFEDACSREVLEETRIQACPATLIEVGDWECAPRPNTSA